MSQKTALITGASRGIGKAIAQNLDNRGYRVLGTATTKAGAESITESLVNGTGLTLDLNDANSIDALFEDIKQLGCDPLVLVNNAGITNDSLFLRMNLDSWQSVINTNLNANFYLTSLVIKKMVKNRWGRVINITSIVGHTGNYGQSNYSASKSGIIGMSKSLALEFAKRNITVNCVSPGFINTKMTDVLEEDQKQKILEQIPMAKIGEPDDVANCVFFLASDNAKYITGETIHVNGGMLMT